MFKAAFAFWSISAALAARPVLGSELIVLRAKETVVRKVIGFMDNDWILDRWVDSRGAVARFLDVICISILRKLARHRYWTLVL